MLRPFRMKLLPFLSSSEIYRFTRCSFRWDYMQKQNTLKLRKLAVLRPFRIKLLPFLSFERDLSFYEVLVPMGLYAEAKHLEAS